MFVKTNAVVIVGALAFLLAAACGSDSSGGGGPATGGAAGAGAGGSGGGVPVAISCKPTCSTPTDCANDILGKAFEAKNFECTAGACVYLGCVSSADCSSTDYECSQRAGQEFPVCNETCFAPVDCIVAGLPLFDESHYACTEGYCEWKGCTSTTECVAGLGEGNVCGQPAGEASPICYEKCNSAADCALPGEELHDANHYLCDEGYCRWTGCKSTAECEAATGAGEAVCQL